VVLFQLLLCCRCCFRCIKCEPEDYNDPKFTINYDKNAPSWGTVVSRKRRNLLSYFLLFAFCAFAADHTVYIGYTKITSAIQTFGDSMGALGNIFLDLQVSGTSLVGNGTNIKTHISQAATTCTYATNLNTYAQKFVSAGQGFTDLTSGIPDKISNTKSTPLPPPLSSLIFQF